MKTFFFPIIQLVHGVLALLIGLSAILNPTHNPVIIAAGAGALALGAVCLWLARECWSGPGAQVALGG